RDPRERQSPVLDPRREILEGRQLLPREPRAAEGLVREIEHLRGGGEPAPRRQGANPFVDRRRGLPVELLVDDRARERIPVRALARVRPIRESWVGRDS